MESSEDNDASPYFDDDTLGGLEEIKIGAMPFVLDSVVDMVNAACLLIRNRPQSLYSVNLDLSIPERVHHKGLDSYFRPYCTLAKALERLASYPDFYDGYLRLNIPLNGRIYRKDKRLDGGRNWFDGEYVWSKKNVQHSKVIVSALRELQRHLQCIGRNDEAFSGKTILDLPELVLTPADQRMFSATVGRNLCVTTRDGQYK